MYIYTLICKDVNNTNNICAKERTKARRVNIATAREKECFKEQRLVSSLEDNRARKTESTVLH